MQETVASITIGLRDTRTGDIEHREYFGELRFHEALYDEPIPITDEDIGDRKTWRELGQLARESDRPLHLADVCRYLGLSDPSHASYHLRRAVQAGVLRKVGTYGGWVPTD